MTEKWGKIKLSKFELSGFYCIGGTCEELFIVLFHSLKGKPCFPLGVASVEVSVKEYYMPEHSLALFMLTPLPSSPHPFSPFPGSPPSSFPLVTSICLLKVLSFWVFTDCQSRVFSCARRTSWGITSCSCYFYHYRHPHCWAKHFASVT